MFGYNSLRKTWNTKWGPEPVVALLGGAADDRAAPITLPGRAVMTGPGTRARRSPGALGVLGNA